MDRRSFIKLTAISGTSAALASCGTPEHQLIRFVPDEDIVPGVAIWKPGICPLCASGCGLTVRVMDADADVVRNGQSGVQRILAAKKLEGSAMYPVNRGGLCARGQAAIQVTYHPDRITQPLKRSGDRGDGRYAAISWDEAIAELTGRLDGLQAAGHQKALAFLMRPRASQRRALIERFSAAFGAAAPVTYELFGDDVLRRANALSFGRAQLPTFDLANARYVIGLGADFLGTWNSPVSHGAAYGEMRQGRPGVRGTFVQVEARMSQTGANADEWIPARPGTEGMLALGLAHVMLSARLRPADGAGRAGARVEGWSAGLQEFTPERVESLTGVPAARIEHLARELADRRPSVVIIGGAPLAHTNGLASALAVNALNALLGSVEQPGGVFFTPQLDFSSVWKLESASPDASRSIEAVARDLLTGGAAAPQVLIVDGANPVFTTPAAWKVREALTRVPFIASVGNFLDETSSLADLILPDHSFLESWSEALPESGSLVGVAGVAPAVMRPIHDTRATEDVLLDIAQKLRVPLELPWTTFEEMLTASFGAFPGSSADTDAWTEAQEKGGWWGKVPPAVAAAPEASANAPPVAMGEPQFEGDPQQYPLHLLPYASSAFLDGSLAHLPWLQEMPDPMTSAMWSSWVEINPATAARLGIAESDVVEIASSQGSLRSAAVISPGIAPDVVAMPAGQGHRLFTRYASGRGENPIELLAPATEPATGSLAWAATRVRVSRAGPPDGRLVLFAGETTERRERGR